MPIPAPRTKIITEMQQALGRAVQTHQVAIMDKLDPARQLEYTKLAVANIIFVIFSMIMELLRQI